jgi:tryptophan synthase beta chain
MEGIIPALETAHAVSAARKLARELGPSGLLIVNVSGRGDKDADQVRRMLEAGEKPARKKARRPTKKALVPGTPSPRKAGLGRGNGRKR